MAELLYGTWEIRSNNILESLFKFPADIESKIYALKYNVNLIELSKKITGIINLKNVIDEYNGTLSQIQIENIKLLQKIEYNILNPSESLYEKYNLVGIEMLKKNDIDSGNNLEKNFIKIKSEFTVNFLKKEISNPSNNILSDLVINMLNFIKEYNINNYEEITRQIVEIKEKIISGEIKINELKKVIQEMKTEKIEKVEKLGEIDKPNIGNPFMVKPRRKK